MNSTMQWPKHLYLIASHHHLFNDQPTRESMGSKAFNLMRMALRDLNVPPALVIGTHYTGKSDACMAAVMTVGLPALQDITGQVFGSSRVPLIVSVRSGAAVSMPGMMETLLNVGLCDQTVSGLLRQTGNPRMVWDAYRRLVSSYGEVVAGLPKALFEDEITRVARGRDERQLDFSEMRDLTRTFLTIYQTHARQPFPQNVNEQLVGAIRAVFASWDAEKARTYRTLNHIDASLGTAVTIQVMVFGNAGSRSGAGVGFTRNPSTGEKRLWVDFLANAQGEDVVSGRRNAHGHEALESIAPDAWKNLERSAEALEREFADMQDFEFTVQDGVLHMLQARSGKRTPLATARIALDLLEEGLIDKETALARTAALVESDLGTLRLSPVDDGNQEVILLGHAMSACSGVILGEIALDAERAAARVTKGIPVILVRQDAETDDIAAFEAACGLLTQRGARTSHAAVVARQLGKVCLVGCTAMRIDATQRTVRFGNTLLKEGDIITLDGNEGDIYKGPMAAVLVEDVPLQTRLRTLRGVPKTKSKAKKKPDTTVAAKTLPKSKAQAKVQKHGKHGS